MNEDRPYNVLFLCTHNSARSVMAECILNRVGQGRFRAFSAGSQPSGRINPYVLDLLQSLKYPTDDLRSKDWAEFARPGVPSLDFVFTVCDNAAGEVCPVWPGHPVTAHWGVPDPSSFEGTEAEKRAFVAEVHGMLQRRIGIFVNLPMRSIDRMSLQQKLKDIGRRADALSGEATA
jgi:protein-tyrosine-phosphatase